jgi:hypothetical protein
MATMGMKNKSSTQQRPTGKPIEAGLVAEREFQINSYIQGHQLPPPNTQMQPTVINKVPFSYARRAAADLER